MNIPPYDLSSCFPIDPIPAASSLVVPFEGDSDRSALTTALSGKYWNSVTFAYLKASYPGPLSEAFTYLTSEGKRYFLPAFIRMCDENPEGVDDLPHSILYCLSDGDTTGDEMVKALNERQKECLRQFLTKNFERYPQHSKLLTNAKRALR